MPNRGLFDLDEGSSSPRSCWWIHVYDAVVQPWRAKYHLQTFNWKHIQRSKWSEYDNNDAYVVQEFDTYEGLQ